MLYDPRFMEFILNARATDAVLNFASNILGYCNTHTDRPPCGSSVLCYKLGGRLEILKELHRRKLYEEKCHNV
jgi:hypothetical protein